MKDLRKVRRLGWALEHVLVVDDTPRKYERSYGNLVAVAPFEGDVDGSDPLRRILLEVHPAHVAWESVVDELRALAADPDSTLARPDARASRSPTSSRTSTRSPSSSPRGWLVGRLHARILLGAWIPPRGSGGPAGS